jgi:hypothetical protein
MISFVTANATMLCHLLVWIKSYGNLLIYSSIQKSDYRHTYSSGVAAARRPPLFGGSHLRDGTRERSLVSKPELL